ncbi:MAG TPA: thiamine-phosphate kinase, partial [Fibrobacteraceae bacterium]|nr:thiamine-phosphate kinase [Fibrobacteraceae bacterium]
PEQAVEKCLLSNLSDINAMGGEAGFVTLGLCLNRSWTREIRERVALAFAQSCAQHRLQILGGDTVAGDYGCFSVTVWGKCVPGATPLRRSEARPGDWLYVSGNLGASAAGLWMLEHETRDSAAHEMLLLHQRPEPPLGLGARLLSTGAHCAIDISDGLSSELHHLALSSGVRLEIMDAQVPWHPALEPFCQRQGLDPEFFWLNGGEEYELLFTSPLSPTLLVLPLWPYRIRCIGRVLPGAGVERLQRDGTRTSIKPGAWSHV